MGISGLLPALKSITETKSLSEYKGKTLAIDGYTWLHRAIYSCSQELCLNQPTDKYITYFLSRVDVLIQFGVIPYVVFDGGPLPMKKQTELCRRERRAQQKELGLKHLKEKNFTAAHKCFVSAADVTPYMAHRVIQELKKRGIQYVVAPYEADAQLGYLVQQKIADGVITEDSDCLLFGCKQVLFKMDRDGMGQAISTDDFKRTNGPMALHSFTPDMILDWCILSGCDYLNSLKGMGLKRAHSLIKSHGTYTKALRAIRLEGKLSCPQNYDAEFEKAKLTFKHQKVYDPVSKTLVPLTEIPSSILERYKDNLEFIGPDMTGEIATGIAIGDIDPITMKRFDLHCITPTRTLPPSVSNVTENIKPSTCTIYRPSRLNAISTKSTPFKLALQKYQNNIIRDHVSNTRKVIQDKTEKPQQISRYFTSITKKRKLEDTVIENVSSFESQEPMTTDLAVGISISPDEKESQMVKENVQPVKENAFSRMLRAGAKLAQKRKAVKKARKFYGGSNSIGNKFFQPKFVPSKVKTEVSNINLQKLEQSLNTQSDSTTTEIVLESKMQNQEKLSEQPKTDSKENNSTQTVHSLDRFRFKL